MIHKNARTTILERMFDKSVIVLMMETVKQTFLDPHTTRKPDCYDLAIVLQLSCGSRISELLHFSQFLEASVDHHINQIAVSKSNTRFHILKPILCYSVAEFLFMFSEMRILLKLETSGAVSTLVNQRLSIYFPVTHVVSHDLRRLYSHMAYVDHGEHENKLEE
jgi:hypothetical protein